MHAALIDTLWDTGIKSAQERAVVLYRAAVDEGHMRRPTIEGGEFIEALLGPFTSSSIAMVTLITWIADIK